MELAAKSQTNSGQWVVKRLRQISGLSKREIARRAQTTPAALVEMPNGNHHIVTRYDVISSMS
jgi:transcriptional regulator with XRE-family HTH domain